MRHGCGAVNQRVLTIIERGVVGDCLDAGSNPSTSATTTECFDLKAIGDAILKSGIHIPDAAKDSIQSLEHIFASLDRDSVARLISTLQSTQKR